VTSGRCGVPYAHIEYLLSFFETAYRLSLSPRLWTIDTNRKIDSTRLLLTSSHIQFSSPPRLQPTDIPVYHKTFLHDDPLIYLNDSSICLATAPPYISETTLCLSPKKVCRDFCLLRSDRSILGSIRDNMFAGAALQGFIDLECWLHGFPTMGEARPEIYIFRQARILRSRVLIVDCGFLTVAELRVQIYIYGGDGLF
jgi:hypothetical protein